MLAYMAEDGFTCCTVSFFVIHLKMLLKQASEADMEKDKWHLEQKDGRWVDYDIVVVGDAVGHFAHVYSNCAKCSPQAYM